MVDIVSVSASMYHTGMYTGIETPMFRISLNTGRTGHTGRFGATLTDTGRTDQHKKKLFIFFIF